MKDKMFKIRDFYCLSDNKRPYSKVDIFIKRNNEFEKVNTVSLLSDNIIKETKKFIEEFMCEEIGKILEDGIIQKEFFRQGYIYKNFENFYKREGICYVSEYDGDKVGEAGISYDGIRESVLNYLILSDVDINKVPEEAINKMIYEVFECVDWQYVNSLIDGDQILDEYIDNFPKKFFIKSNELTEQKSSEVMQNRRITWDNFEEIEEKVEDNYIKSTILNFLETSFEEKINNSQITEEDINKIAERVVDNDELNDFLSSLVLDELNRFFNINEEEIEESI